ncbi:unnamed protein product, partial [Effrenium voratum]
EEAVRHNAAIARQLLRHLEVQFLDTSRWDAEMQTHGVSQENVVNQGYRRLVFSAFRPDLPEEILVKGPLDPLAPWNVMCKGTVVGVTDQRFARAENMISAHEPCFDPALFGRMGKVMDSWESVRHNFRAFDACAVELPADSRAAKCGVRFVQMSTKYHDGNEAPFVSIEVADTFPGLLPELDGSSGSNGASGWRTLVPKLAMGPHAYRLLDLGTSSPPFRFVRVRMFPDGGFTRLGLYPEDLPEDLARNFKPVDWASAPSSVRYTDPIPTVTKPLCAPFVALPEEIAERLRALQPGESVNVASAALGACIVSASDQHYSAAANVLSPRPPVSMFDALESKRSRQGLPGASADDKGVVQLVVKLAYPCVLSKLRVDFTFLVNNAPMEMCVEACESLDGEWWILVERQRVKHFSGGKWEVALDPKKSSGYLRVSSFPCGGFNRLEDAKLICKACRPTADGRSSYDAMEKSTMAYVRKNYKFTKAGDKAVRSFIAKMGAKQGARTKAMKAGQGMSLMEENQRLQEKVEMQAGAEAEQLRRLLRETEEASTAAATGEAEASAEAEQLRRLLRETEDETATAIRAAVGDLRAKLQEEAAATDATAGAEAQQMRDRLRHVEDETATAIKAAVGDLREKLKTAEEASAAASMGQAEASAETQQLRRKLRDTEDETATAIRAAVGDLRAKLQEEAAATNATAGQAEAAAAATAAAASAEAAQMRDRLKHVEDKTAADIREAVGDLRARLQDTEEHAAASEHREEELRAQLLALEASAKAGAEAEEEALRLRTVERSAEESQQECEDLRAQLRAMEAGAKAGEAAEEEALRLRTVERSAEESQQECEDLRAQLRAMEADLRAQLRKMEAGAKAGEAAEEEALRLRTVERSAEESQQECQDLRAQLRKMEAGAKAGEAAEEEALRLRTVERSAEESQQECQDLRAQLRKMEAGAKTGPDEEEAQRRLRKAERSVEESEQECQGLQARLRHREKAETQLVLEVEDLRSRLKKASAQEVGHVGVQTDTESHHVTFEKRKTRKSVFFNTEGKQPLPGGVDDDEKPTGRVRSARSDRMKSVDFGGKDSSVSYVPESSEDEGGSEVPVSASTSMFSQVSEYYDTYNETSQPVRNRTRSTIESYSEEDLWDPEHVAMVTRKLFPKHDKNGTNRIEWSSGEAIAFLEEFFWLHKQPPPKIAKAAFHSLYSQVKTENSGYDYTATDEGLNVEEMTSFAMKVHQFIYKQLGKEMREQRKSFAVSEEDMKTLHRASVEMALGEDATSVLARMTRRTTIVAPPDTSLLG